MPLILPESVTVRLKQSDGERIELANVILRIDTTPTAKNAIRLFPFATDRSGVARIAKAEMQAEVSATYDSGLMDYAPIESAEPSVVISICSNEEIQRAITARTTVWKSLLRGEKERWGRMENLLALFRSAANVACEALNVAHGIWNKPGAHYEYDIQVRKKG
jgi:hypothetical protein